MSPKYRQPGYQDRNEDPKKGGMAERPSRKETFGPRPLQMPGTRTVSRCSQCGTLVHSVADPGACIKCGFDLHSCRQCTHFDPSSRFECAQPILERIARKDARNACTSYVIRQMVEKETSESISLAPQKPDDARRAFEALFKK